MRWTRLRKRSDALRGISLITDSLNKTFSSLSKTAASACGMPRIPPKSPAKIVCGCGFNVGLPDGAFDLVLELVDIRQMKLLCQMKRSAWP